jgi:hypothetical protein
MMEVICSSGTLVDFHWTTQHFILDKRELFMKITIYWDAMPCSVIESVPEGSATSIYRLASPLRLTSIYRLAFPLRLTV